ncbi:hypothetical protein PSTG_13013 [Puccinia striiformis f. sp. tritici PST-78]|uniref:Uncharacterized protein n=1 Tax=Puccinia striiformis f. sp. tritici PST-78 TaxID=1165861 RepID=A0A0L0V2X8_9BASI|nr:hypothetical protein PSTG_13013 [Puccinia striiformis f. sp. tritici PST-78]
MSLWNFDDMVGRLFSQWDLLETVELNWLTGRSDQMIRTVRKPIPTLDCVLQMMTLKHLQIDGSELSRLLKIVGGGLQTLEISEPGIKMGRAGLCQVLKDWTHLDLECLKIKVNSLLEIQTDPSL